MSTNTKPLAGMLLSGTLAGFLSGLMNPLALGLRGAAFGLCLALTIVMVRRYRWKPTVFLPGLILGVGLAFFTLNPLPDLEFEHRAFDVVSLINCTLAIPAFAAAYLSPSWKGRIWKMLLVGLISSALRAISFDSSWDGLALVMFNFPIGMLPFLILWLIAMRLTDPNLVRPKPDACADNAS